MAIEHVVTFASLPPTLALLFCVFYPLTIDFTAVTATHCGVI